jgi:glycosyltransferase involved in cell wall biosynthesis
VSEYVASGIERRPDAVILNGVPPSPRLWRSSSRTVLVLQRLEPEKDTIVALRAWKASRLFEEGWVMRVVGDGSERAALEGWVASEGVQGVTFVGWVPSAKDELANAGVLLASAPSEPFGLAVVEAMAAGVPVAASAAGGHLETVGQLPGASMFRPGDAFGAAAALRSLLADSRRARLSEDGRHLIALQFTVARHVESLIAEYNCVLRRKPGLVSEQVESGLRSQ